MKGVVNIDIYGLPMNPHDVMWIQRSGVHEVILSDINFGAKIMRRWKQSRREALRQIVRDLRGVQGI